MSTEVVVRNRLVETIQGIATTKLGFNKLGGNVKDYDLQYENINESHRVNYLMADVDDAQRRIRCWSVDVNIDHEEPAGMNKLMNRVISAQITGYYSKGVAGSGVKLIREHTRYVLEAIRELAVTLDKTVDLITVSAGGAVEVEESGIAQEEDGLMLVKRLQMTLSKEGGVY